MAARVLLALLVLTTGPAFPAGAEPPEVIVAETVRLAFPQTTEALGTARANESIEIRSQITEKVTRFGFREGELVEPGRVLVELENRQAQAELASARAGLAESEGQLRRAQELIKTRALSAAELEQRVAARDADLAAVDAAEARLADTAMRAPFAGRVGLRRVSVGALVGPDTVITTLDDVQTIKLDFDVPETALSLLAEGMRVVARSAAWPDQVFEGRVESIDTRVDPVSRSVTARARIPNDAGRLRPGMFLTVRLVRDDVTALLIPEQAIVPEQSRQFVFVVKEDGSVEKREVRVGRRRPGQVEILSGLEQGELVVAEGTQKVHAGAVRIGGRLDVRSLADDGRP